MILNSPYISGSLTVTGNIISSGSITISGSIASASYASNAERVDGLDATSFVFTSSYNTDSASVSTRVTRIEGNYATTGSNVFMGAQTVCANITSTGTIIAQTLNVQQVTSSIVYSSGSNTFGCDLSNVQQFTGSVRITGSLNTVGIACFSNVVCTPTVIIRGTTTGATANASANRLVIDDTENGLSILSSTAGAGYINFGDSANNSSGQFIYDHSADALRIFTSASEKMRITSTGNVGIGTCSPSGQLHLKGASGLTNFGDQMLQVESSTSNYSGIVFSGTNGSNAAIRSEGASTMTFWTATGTTYTERMRITCGGLVGIGTCTPDVLLTVDGQTGGASTVNIARIYASKGQTDAAYLQIQGTRHPTASVRRIALDALDGGGSSASLVLQQNGGNVGVGTTNPVDCIIGSGTILEVAGTAGGSVKLRYTSATNFGEFSLYKGTNGSYIDSAGATTAANNDLIFRTAGAASYGVTERMRIDSSGVVRLQKTGDSQPIVRTTSTTGARSATWNFQEDATNIFQIGFWKGNSYDASHNAVLLRAIGADDIHLMSCDISRMIVTSGGLIGINTLTPVAPLQAVCTPGSFYGIIETTACTAGTAKHFRVHKPNYVEYGIGILGDNSFHISTASTFPTTNGLTLTSAGYLYVGKCYGDSFHRITRLTSEGGAVLIVSGYDTSNNNSIQVNGASGASANAAATVLWVATNSSTSRSINAGGTINASGADYAEYMTKAIEDNIAKGDIVGVNAEGKLTNVFDDAVSFVVKSTDPSYVGGDTWGNEEIIGEKRPTKTTDETEEEFASKLSAFEAKLEEARAKVDRISFSGQIPCNVYGATVGDYIIPIKLEDGKIGGQAVSNPNLEQYQKSVGKVWKIMNDGRAWIAVKIG